MKQHLMFMVANMNIGGTEKSLLSLLDVIPREKYEVTLLLLEKSGGYINDVPDWVVVDVVEGFHRMKPIINNPPLETLKKMIQKGELIRSLGLAFTYLEAKLRTSWTPFYRYALSGYKTKRKFDCAVAYAGPSNFITYFVANYIDAPRKIQWIHFDVSKLNLKKTFGEKYYRYFDSIICVSQGSRDQMIDLFPKYAEKTIVFGNVVSREGILHLAKLGDGFNGNYGGIKVLTIGRLSKEKGQWMIPNVVERLRNEGFEFKWYCIGDGNIRHDLKSEIKEKGLDEHLILLGLQRNPYRFLIDCDVYVQTSLHEGYGLTIHEAKVCGRPMVITNVASAKDLVQDNITGLIVEISELGIYKGVKNLIEDNALRKKFENNLKHSNSKESDNYRKKVINIFN